jgi:hypothetical protein
VSPARLGWCCRRGIPPFAGRLLGGCLLKKIPVQIEMGVGDEGGRAGKDRGRSF